MQKIIWRKIKFFVKKLREIFKFSLNKGLHNQILLRERLSNVYYWNPKKLIINKKNSVNNIFLLKVFGRRINNFGDLLVVCLQ